MARLTKLIVENFKRIKAIEYSPEGNVTIVGGLNEQGKSSLLDSISVLLEGKAAKIPQPVRTGAKKAMVIGEITSDSWDAFGNCTITRTISAGGNWSVKVQDKDGTQIKSPETKLRKIFGDPMDPVAFVNMPGKERAEMLKKITGLDFTELDVKKATAYDKRTLVGREIKALEGFLATNKLHDDVPEKEIVIDELMKEIELRQKINDDNKIKRQLLENITIAINHDVDYIKGLEAQIASLQKEVEIKIEAKNEKIRKKDILQQEIKDLQDIDLAEIKQKISTASEINRLVNENQQIKSKKTELSKKQKEYRAFTNQIDEFEKDKQNQLAAANLPVEGLSFTDDNVLYNGLPFDKKQLSSEELLRVSFAISIAAQPNLKNILIKEGSLLDKNNLKLIAEMAEQNDIHVFVECVGDDASKSTIVIENGEIKAPVEKNEDKDFSEI